MAGHGGASAAASCSRDLGSSQLAEVLEQQQNERNETWTKQCIFCPFSAERAPLVLHMAIQHKFKIGNPDNLVYVADLIELLRSKFNNYCCIYCERIFKGQQVLKKHMKTKKHMRINPKLPLYDRFFISSYTPEQALRENEDSEEDPTGDTIDDWQEEPKASDTCCLCLFCDMTFDSSAFMLSHCSEQHLFNLTAIQSKWELTYYDTVMLVNFIRSSVKNNTCVQCYTIFASKTLLLDHMTHVKHFTPDSILRPWNSEKFLFPVLDPDPLLFCLDPNDSDAQEDTPTQITPTTGPNTSTTSTNPTAVKPSEPPHKP